jgi:hypothetical protein
LGARSDESLKIVPGYGKAVFLKSYIDKTVAVAASVDAAEISASSIARARCNRLGLVEIARLLRIIVPIAVIGSKVRSVFTDRSQAIHSACAKRGSIS